MFRNKQRPKRRIRYQVIRKPQTQGSSARVEPLSLCPSGFAGFGARRRVALTYQGSVVFAATAGADTYTSYSFRANGIYDPDASGVGHQPLGRDQYALFFRRYVVLSSSIACTATIIATSSVPETIGVLVHYSGNPSTSSLTTLLEQSGARHKTLSATAGLQPVTLTHSFNPKTWFGVRNVEDVSELDAEQGNNPERQAMFTIFVGSLTTASSQTAIEVVVTYDVLFREPTEVPSS